MLNRNLFLVLVLSGFLALGVFAVSSARKVTLDSGPGEVKRSPTPFLRKEDSECHVDTEYKNKTHLNIVGERKISDEKETLVFGIVYKDYPLATLVGKSGEVVAFDFDRGENQVAFILDDGLGEGKGKRTVYIYDLQSKKTRKVYEAENKAGDTLGDYYLQIKDVGLSDDGTLLAITTATGGFLYSYKEGEVTKLFEKPPKDPDKMGVYGYFSPGFSQDNSKLLLTAGYYEGSGWFMYDLKERRLVDLDYSAYVSGTWVLGWYESRLVIAVGEYSDENSNYFLVDPLDRSKQEVLFAGPRESRGEVIGGRIYYSSAVRSESGISACNNVGTKYEVTEVIGSMHSYDIPSGSQETLLTIDGTESSGVRDPAYIIKSFSNHILDGKPQNIVAISKSDDNESKQVYVLDSRKPFGLTRLDF